MSERGSIKFFSEQKKYGFITRDKENAEVFFHINDCEEFEPRKDLTVEFEIGKDRQDRTKAIRIKRVDVDVSVGVGGSDGQITG